MRRLALSIVLMGSIAGSTAFAKTELELDLSALEYSMTKTKSDFDEVESTSDTTELMTLEPNLTINAFADKLWLVLSMATGEDGTSGTLIGGYRVAPAAYAGLMLRVERSKEDSETEVGTAKSDSESENNLMAIGPTGLYRDRSGNSTLEVYGALLRLSGDENTENGTTDTETSLKVLFVAIGTDYYIEIADRIHLGAGVTFQTSLSGEVERKSGGVETDGDFDTTETTLKLAQVRLEI